MTATQAAGSFATLLDAVEHGEAVVITRDGAVVGRFVPERRTTADRLKEALRDDAADPAFADELEAVHADLRVALGKPRSAYDMIIAATAVAEGRTLLTTDVSADFTGLAGLHSELVRTSR